MYRQYDLVQGQTRLTCWLDSDKRLDVGTQVRLARPENVAGRPPDGWWTVVGASRVQLSSAPDVRWRVGGLA